MTGRRPRSLSVFFPSYNESATIEETVRRTVETLRGLPDLEAFEVLVVDDGSTDGTCEIVRRLRAEAPQVRLVTHPRNLGYGAALNTGYLEARMDAVFYTDADLPIDLAEIGRAWKALAEADAVIGYRIRRHDTPRRWLYSKVYNLLVRLLRGVRVRDVNFSFKMIRRSALEGVILRSRTVYVDGELLGEIFERGARVIEIPVAYRPRKVGASSFDHPFYALATLLELGTDLLLRRVHRRRRA